MVKSSSQIHSHILSDGSQLQIEMVSQKGKNVRHGEVNIYAANGQRVLNGFYINDIPHGRWRRWYSSGTLLSEHEYKNGNLQGSYRQYFDNGKIASSGTYIKNRLSSEKMCISVVGSRNIMWSIVMVI